MLAGTCELSIQICFELLGFDGQFLLLFVHNGVQTVSCFEIAFVLSQFERYCFGIRMPALTSPIASEMPTGYLAEGCASFQRKVSFRFYHVSSMYFIHGRDDNYHPNWDDNIIP